MKRARVNASIWTQHGGSSLKNQSRIYTPFNKLYFKNTSCISIGVNLEQVLNRPLSHMDWLQNQIRGISWQAGWITSV
jgi:hypothetical protein